MTTDSPYFWIALGFGALYIGVYTYALVIGPWLRERKLGKPGALHGPPPAAKTSGREWTDEQTGGW